VARQSGALTSGGDRRIFVVSISAIRGGTMAALKHMTNATKANIIALVNATILCLQTFGVPINNAQQAAIGGLVNAALVVWIGLTYKSSKMRADEPQAAAEPATDPA
jgi:hypothetical protein